MTTHGSPAADLGDVQPVERNGERLDQRALVEADAVGQPPEHRLVHDHGLGVGARVVAHADPALHRRPEVVVVERRERVDADAVPGRVTLDALADCVHDARELVAHDRARLDRRGREHVQVGAADPAGLDLHPHLAGAGLGGVEVPLLEAAVVGDHDRPHAGGFTFSNIASARSRCSRSCVAITLVRSSALPGGTAGWIETFTYTPAS